MPTSDNSISRLIINELTQAQYDALINAGQINPNELYMVTDGSYPVVNDFANVAFTGEYSDLLNTPTIPEAQVQSDWNASSGMGVILNKPTIPTVDQTYNALSTNAQSGIAVAEAINSRIQIVNSAEYANITPVANVIYFVTD